MSQRIYISADYSIYDGDRNVVDVLHSWGNDNLHKVDYIDTAQVITGSVTDDPDCRSCDLKAEFNRQINASSAVIFVIGDKTAIRTAGSSCQRNTLDWYECPCTPYKQNTNGQKNCKVYNTCGAGSDVGCINSYSYLKHEFLQAEKRRKNIIIFYNSMYRWATWLPNYMKEYEAQAQPFWVKNSYGGLSGNYDYLKKALGYE